MNFRLRSLYAKIFLWFCLTVMVTSTLVLAVAGLTGSQPFGRRWMAMTQDLYAHSAVDFYMTGGAPALSRYLDTIDKNSGIEGHLIDARGADVLGMPFPAHAVSVYRRTQKDGLSAGHLGRYWTAASTVSAGGQRYIFVMEAHPLRGFLDGTFLFSATPRLIGGLLLVALFCLLLARHITRPILLLEAAATSMAGGDLSVRTLPALRGRTDELAAMAAAFDGMAERIETLLQTQRQMLADISHELRSPLTRIGVSLELLRRGETDVLEPMQADLDRLNVMIGQVLELTRFELQEGALSSREVDLKEIVGDVVESANYEGRGAEKVVRLDAPAGACRMVGDRAALRSCVENIVRNALQHSPAGGLIEMVLAQEATGLIRLRVDDSGPGVPEDSVEKLFTPFYRVPGVSEGHPQGSGLGLSISARVVARQGGEIVAKNRLPHGLSVSVTLPGLAPRVS
jgi:two-component system sensor histidine kinase CpxA